MLEKLPGSAAEVVMTLHTALVGAAPSEVGRRPLTAGAGGAVVLRLKVRNPLLDAWPRDGPCINPVIFIAHSL